MKYPPLGCLTGCLFPLLSVAHAGETLKGEAAHEKARAMFEAASKRHPQRLSSTGKSAAKHFVITQRSPRSIFEVARVDGRTMMVIRQLESGLPLAVNGDDWAVVVSAEHPGAFHYLAGCEGSYSFEVASPGESEGTFNFAGFVPDPSFEGAVTLDVSRWLKARPATAADVPESIEASMEGRWATFLQTRGGTAIRLRLNAGADFLIADMASSSAEGHNFVQASTGADVPEAWRKVELGRILGSGVPFLTQQGSEVQWKKRQQPDFFRKPEGRALLLSLMGPLGNCMPYLDRPVAEWPPGMVAAAKTLAGLLPPVSPPRIEPPATPTDGMPAPDAAPPTHPLPTEADVVVPFEVASGIPHVRMAFDGGGEAWFMLDTGSSTSLVAPQFGGKWQVGKVLGGTLQDAKGERSDLQAKVSPPCSLGTWQLGPLSLVEGPLPQISKSLLAGALGCDLLSEHPFTIDFPRQQLTFHRRGSFKPPQGAMAVALDPREQEPVAPLTLEGLGTLPAIIDTGMSDAASVWQPLEAAALKSLEGLRRSTDWTVSHSGLMAVERFGWPAERRAECLGSGVGRPFGLFVMSGDRGSLPRAAVGAALMEGRVLTFDLASHRLWVATPRRPSVAERVAAGWKIDGVDLSGRTALAMALWREDRAAAAELLAAGAHFLPEGARIHPVEAAVTTGNVSLMTWAAGQDSEKSWVHSAALTAAIESRIPEAISWLLEHGIDVTGNPGAMRAAAAVGDTATAARLFERGVRFALPEGARPPDQGAISTHPLSRAIFDDQPKFLQWALRTDPASVRALVDGHSLLSWSLYAGRTECTRILLAAGADPVAPEVGGYIPLVEAINCGRAEMLDLMLTPDVVERAAKVPNLLLLHAAAESGQTGCLKVLLGKKWKVNGTDAKGTAAAHMAALALIPSATLGKRGKREHSGAVPLAPVPADDHAGCLRTLLEAGADPMLKVNGLPLPHVIAGFRWGGADLFEACFPNGIEREKAPLALAAAIESDNVPMVRYLLDHGYSATAAIAQFGPPLDHAIAFRSTGAALALLSHKADIHAPYRNGFQPLHLAACYNDTFLIQTLLAAGAKPTDEDRDGNTPLHYAIEYRALAAVRALVAAGADPAARAGLFPAIKEAETLDPPYPALVEALRHPVKRPPPPQ